MQPLSKLLGKELTHLISGEKLTTAELAKTCQTIGLLFVADQPLRPPKYSLKDLEDIRDSLIELCKELKKRNDGSLEVILVPMDEFLPNEDSKLVVKKFFSQQDSPFLLISSEKSTKLQEYLVRKFGIRKTPALTLVNASNMELISYDAKAKLLQDPKGIQFPWRCTFSEMLNSAKVIKNCNKQKNPRNENSGSLETQEVPPEQWRATIKGLLFASYWCPPCRPFVTLLNELYERINQEGQKFEIFFVSCDRSLESYERFFSTMPWLAIPYADEKLRDDIIKAYQVEAIPSFVILDANDVVVTTEGRPEVLDDVEGIDFPWYPRLVDDLSDRHSSIINNFLCVIYFTDNSETDYDKAENMLNSIAAEISSSEVEEALEPKFFIGDNSDLAESLRVFMELDEGKSNLVITDVTNSRYAVQDRDDEQKDIDEASIRDFLHKFQTNQLIGQYLQTPFTL